MNELSIQRVVPHLPVALAWLLTLAIGVQAALIARELIPQPESEPAPVATAGIRPSAQASATQSMDLQPVLNAHLFGEVAADSGPEGDPANAPQTQLSLVLAGTIAVEDPEKGIGLIGPTASNAKVYSVGEAVDGGVKLHAVYVDRVILNRSGKLEALYLPRQLARTAPPPTARAQGQGQGPNTAAGLANRVRQMMNQDPGTLAEIMRPQPVFADGGQRGYRVYPGRNRAQFQRLGLTPGDLILSINGTPLNDPARGMEVFRTLGASSQVSVTIERAGQQQELVLDMTQLANQVEELNPASGAVPMDQAAQPPPNPQPE